MFSSDWLYLYVRAHGCLALETQLAEAKDALREAGGEEEGGLADRVALVGVAVTLSRNVLSKQPEQLFEQLHSRLEGHTDLRSEMFAPSRRRLLAPAVVRNDVWAV